MLVSTTGSDSILSVARNGLLDFRIPAAESDLYRLARRPDGSPAAYYHLTVSSFLKFIMSDKDTFRKEFWERRDSLENILDDQPPGHWREYLRAESGLMHSIVHAKRGSFVKAAFAGRSAYRKYESVRKERPRFYEVYKGLGLLHMSVGSLPGLYRKFLSVLGMRGTAEEGLRELRLAADSSRYSSEDARILLGFANSIVPGSVEDGGPPLRSLYLEHPDSPLFAHLYGFYLFSRRRAAAAEDVLAPIAAMYGSDAVFYVDYIDYFLAQSLFRQDRYEESIPLFRRYIELHHGLAVRAMANLYVGLALEMLGRRDEAVVYYRQVRATRERDNDHAAARHANRVLSRPMDDADRRLLRARTAFDSGRYEESIVLAAEVAAIASATEDQRAEAYYRLGRAYEESGQDDEAFEAFGRAVAAGGRSDARYGPWSEYHRGLILESKGQLAAAEQAFRRAKRYDSPFDYENVLERDLRFAFARLDGKADG
jgi:tetratricopeptide (TPR) repeat protein